VLLIKARSIDKLNIEDEQIKYKIFENWLILDKSDRRTFKFRIPSDETKKSI
jgi:hypothetical protein